MSSFEKRTFVRLRSNIVIFAIAHVPFLCPRLAHLREEALVQASRSLADQYPGGLTAHVLVGVQVAPGDVDKGVCDHSEGLLAV